MSAHGVGSFETGDYSDQLVTAYTKSPRRVRCTLAAIWTPRTKPKMSKTTYRFDRAAEEIFKPIWLAGWHGYSTVIATAVVLGFFGRNTDGGAVVWGFWGLFLGAAIHLAGVYYVNDRWREVVEAFVMSAEESASQMSGMAGEEINSYTLRSSNGRRRLVKPNRLQHVTVLIVGNSSMAVFDDAELELNLLRLEVGQRSREFFFDSITSVNYQDPYFQLKTADGETNQYISTRKPDDALYDLQNRLRDFKRGTIEGS